MAYAYSELAARAQAFAQQALAAQRLTVEQAQALCDIDSRCPEQLFADAAQRPLIVAFIGGTGVGKSSLLNRLAGEAVAKVGIERPTSREVTLYHHRALSMSRLPPDVPLDKVFVRQHSDANKQHIIWIDMPDMDSIERANSQRVLEWLPYIDVLVYVVSPERYRDNKAWQVLQAEGGKHGWLFVINQWDRGQSAQFDDFKQQLAKAGFAQPLVFRTICTATDEADDFAALVETLQGFASGQTLEQLERRGNEARLQLLQTQLADGLARLERVDFAALNVYFQQQWQVTAQALTEGLAFGLQRLAQVLAIGQAQADELRVWDHWAQGRLQDCVDGLVLKAEDGGLAVKPLQAALSRFKTSQAARVEAVLQTHGRQALLQPGHPTQRFLLRFAAVCEVVLPLSAMAAVGYQVFVQFYQNAAQQSNAYLGADFAVHSALLIGLSWLIPFFVHKKMQPSLEKTALLGLQRGLAQALVALELDMAQCLNEELRQHEALRSVLRGLLADCQQARQGDAIGVDEPLARLLCGDWENDGFAG